MDPWNYGYGYGGDDDNNNNDGNGNGSNNQHTNDPNAYGGQYGGQYGGPAAGPYAGNFGYGANYPTGSQMGDNFGAFGMCGGQGGPYPQAPQDPMQHFLERMWNTMAGFQPPPPPPLPTIPPPHVPTPPHDPTNYVEKFLRLQPSVYAGGTNSDRAEQWVHQIEGIFNVIDCPDREKVTLATHQLRGYAQEWWRLQMQSEFARRSTRDISWQEFLKVFNGTFFPLEVQREKREEFLNLKQGDMSVLEYQMKFISLSRYAPYLAGNEEMKAERFIAGLRPELQQGVVAHMCESVTSAAHRAAALERSIQASREEEEPRTVRRHFPKGKTSSRSSSSSGSGSGMSKIGSRFKKLFRGGGSKQKGKTQVAEESMMSTGQQSPQQSAAPSGIVCFTCGKKGHIAKFCRAEKSKKTPSFQVPLAGSRAHVMAITRAQAEASNLIEGEPIEEGDEEEEEEESDTSVSE